MHLLKLKPKCFIRPQSAFEQHGGEVAEKKRVIWLNRLLPSFRADTVQRSEVICVYSFSELLSSS